MSTEIQPPQVPAPHFPRQRSDARIEGRGDAFDEPQHIIAARIANMRDCATAHDDAAAQRWTDEYAAGAHATWRALDALRTDLDALEGNGGQR